MGVKSYKILSSRIIEMKNCINVLNMQYYNVYGKMYECIKSIVNAQTERRNKRVMERNIKE